MSARLSPVGCVEVGRPEGRALWRGGTFGHSAGDAVLVKVAHLLRDSIGDAGLVCRVGGDEFAVPCPVAPDRDRLDALCQSIIEAVRRPTLYNGEMCRIGTSIGCAMGRGPNNSQAVTIEKADTALYAANEACRNCYRAYPDEAWAA